jgi:hypothetical protein
MMLIREGLQALFDIADCALLKNKISNQADRISAELPSGAKTDKFPR